MPTDSSVIAIKLNTEKRTRTKQQEKR